MGFFNTHREEQKESKPLINFETKLEELTEDDKEVLRQLISYIHGHSPSHLEVRTKGFSFTFNYKR